MAILLLRNIQFLPVQGNFADAEMRALPVRILFERAIIMGQCVLPGALIFIDVSVHLVQQGRALPRR